MDEALNELGESIAAGLADAVTGFEVARGELTVETDPEHLIKLLKYLRDDANCQFKQLIDLCGADYPEREDRFEVVYHLLSLKQNQRIRVRVRVAEGALVPSATGVFSAAGWYEREVWDMFGVMFSDHPDLRRMLSDYGFEGHPLRKDFPLTGYVEVRYSDELKRVVYEPVKLTQEFRSFDFMSPWEGAQYIRDQEEAGDAGDDKAV